MKFVPVPGTQVLFGIWDTRVKDYQAFCDATSRAWVKPSFTQTENDPAVNVSWDDAEAFCNWLTQRDRQAGLIGANQSYRLLSNNEWSKAVGGGKYPWGDRWPPPRHAGNYADEAFAESLPGSGWNHIPGNDGFARTSPVGSFRANEYGLYDMGGNVLQWCEDWYRKEMNSEALREKYPVYNNDGGGNTKKVTRGASWDCNNPDFLLSSCRGNFGPVGRIDSIGFRCVVVVSGR